MRPALAVLAAAALVAAGCGSSDDDAAPPTSVAPASTPPPPSSSTSTVTETGGIDPLEGASTRPASAPPPSAETALLERVSVARHEGYDRVVFQFRNGLPGYRIQYVQPPLVEDGSGARVKIAGSRFVQLRFEPASGFDLTVPEGELVYKGPRRISGADAGTAEVQEVVRTGDFEAVLTWAVGLADQVDFRVTTLESPPRVVVDFRNH